MRPRVMSMWSVRQYQCDEPHVVISVRSPGTDKVSLPENPNRIGILYLAFHDITESEQDYSYDPVAFSDEAAASIRDFLAQHKDLARAIICNCEAGISRSAAIAAAIAKSTENDDEWYFRMYHPNSLVYRKTLMALTDQCPSM